MQSCGSASYLGWLGVIVLLTPESRIGTTQALSSKREVMTDPRWRGLRIAFFRVEGRAGSSASEGCVGWGHGLVVGRMSGYAEVRSWKALRAAWMV